MKSGRTPLKAPLAVSLLFAAFALVAATPARAQEQEVPRRPRGPAAGPVIKLPRGEGAPADEQQPAENQRAQQAAPIRWEYCIVTANTFKTREIGLSTRHIPTATINYHPGNFEEVEGGTPDAALLNAFAKLGDEGWELAGVREKVSLNEGTGSSTPVFYFKRPKRQE